MKIRTRLVLAAVCTVFPILIGLAIITGEARYSDREKTLDLIEEYINGIKSGLEAFFYTSEELAVYLARLQGEMQLEWSDGGRRVFEAFVASNARINNAAYINERAYFFLTGREEGSWIGGSGRTSGGVISVSEPYIPLGLGYRAIVTTAPITRGGSNAGFIEVMQTSDEFSSVYANLAADFMDRFGTRAQMHVISDGGQLVSSLQYSEEVHGYTETLAGSTGTASAGSLGQEALDVFDAALNGDESIITTRLGNEVCFVSSARIGNTPFVLCFAVPQSSMLSSTRAIMVTSVILFFVIEIFLLVIIRAATRLMLISLNAMHGTMQDIAEGDGDLTARLDVKGNDEISAIGSAFNKFVGSIHGMVSNVSESAASLAAVGKALSGSVDAISGGVSGIANDIETLNFSVGEQSASVAETSATVTQIAKTIESLTRQIEGQSSAVTESSASVQQMLSNIAEISTNLTKASSGFDELKETAANGRESLNAVQNLVNKLSLQSDSLLEANSVIEDIAAQTNLLAMNAAIEAAHAGEAGKGFAVVADEIRKLAENSAAQSKTIAAGLKAAVSSIKTIAQATATADVSFESVSTKIGSVAALAENVSLAMLEQNEGSRQVIEALQDIENVTESILSGTVEMNAGTETILKEINRLSGISQQVQERSSSIAKSAEAINEVVAEIVSRGGANREAVGVLVDITSKFKL